MKLAIIGTRGYFDYAFVKEVIGWHLDADTIVSGDASGDGVIGRRHTGADTLARCAAYELGLTYEGYAPEYDKYNPKLAPLERNKLIVAACDELVAFWNMSSRGTLYTIDKAKAKNKKVEIIDISMSWDQRTIEALMRGETVQFRPRGNSMSGKIEDGDLVTVEPVANSDVKVGDIVLCRCKGHYYLHLVTAIDGAGRFQIGNNKGRINGWTRSIYGRVTNVE